MALGPPVPYFGCAGSFIMATFVTRNDRVSVPIRIGTACMASSSNCTSLVCPSRSRTLFAIDPVAGLVTVCHSPGASVTPSSCLRKVHCMTSATCAMIADSVWAGSGPAEPWMAISLSRSLPMPNCLPCRTACACARTACSCVAVAAGVAQGLPPCVEFRHRIFSMHRVGSLCSMSVMMVCHTVGGACVLMRACLWLIGVISSHKCWQWSIAAQCVNSASRAVPS